MVYTSDYVLDYPEDATISDIFFDYNIGGALPNAPAIIDGLTGETSYSYASLRIAVRRLARYFQETLHVARGDVVCILAFNTVHYPVYVHAVLAVGGVVSGLNPFHVPQELAYALSIARPRHVLTTPELVSNLHASLELVQIANARISVLSTRPLHRTTNLVDVLHILQHGSTHFNQPKYAENEVSTELAFICFSSGTSGLPKGVKLSHGNIVSNVYMHSIYLSDMFTPSSVFALVVPFFHILGLEGFTCLYVLNGSPIVVFPKFDLPSLLVSMTRDKGALLYHHRENPELKLTVTHLNVVPPIALQLLNDHSSSSDQYASLRCLMNAAAPLEQSATDRLCSKLECSLTQWYGLTEASPSVISQRHDQVHVKGSVGKLLPGLTMKIVDVTGNECPHSIPGELLVKGPNVMQGYVGNMELTNDTITADGYLRTGDIGYVDDNGYVFLVDRLKEMIKVKGNQVAPAELEGILRLHPEVTDAAVRGNYIAAKGTEVPVAYVVLRSRSSVATSLHGSVLSFVNQRVSSYKKIHDLVIVEEIPRNAGGKILRRMLPDVEVKTGMRESSL